MQDDQLPRGQSGGGCADEGMCLIFQAVDRDTVPAPSSLQRLQGALHHFDQPQRILPRQTRDFRHGSLLLPETAGAFGLGIIEGDYYRDESEDI